MLDITRWIYELINKTLFEAECKLDAAPAPRNGSSFWVSPPPWNTGLYVRHRMKLRAVTYVDWFSCVRLRYITYNLGQLSVHFSLPVSCDSLPLTSSKSLFTFLYQCFSVRHFFLEFKYNRYCIQIYCLLQIIAMCMFFYHKISLYYY